ncbi:lipopolysaccharide biosynthesis protein [Dongia deserti]|uniref:lipopolysaccharide biosynthesis protein n=1 Tax=Dongia deserti TaxID=2268030 RepID=UPI002546E872|nr:lipopolysaccharide biosynthesis protein [Dongia deserti]
MTGMGSSELKRRTIRGGAAKLCGQAVNFALRLGFMIVLVRLLSPHDFGLVAMVTVVTGIYGMFTSAGLSSATVQKEHVTDAQISTLFWINVSIGVVFALLCVATAPVLVSFYREPRLFWIAIALATGFLVTGAGVQHAALLQRHLRYPVLTFIETLSQSTSSALGITLAVLGYGYWSLVAAAVTSPAITTACVWLAAKWRPGRPDWSADIRSMLLYGGTITLNGLVVYIGYNLEKVLLGRVWGADVLGLYGRAYQLISVPTDYLNGAIGGVAFSALSRLQGDPATFKRYFLRGYGLAISMTLPVTIFCVVFADEIILVLFGQAWAAAAPIFRLLAPTVLIFGIINPLAWLLLSIGLQGRSLRIALVIAPLVMSAYLMGLPYGPTGVAAAYSAAMMLWVVPHVLWCLKGTTISILDVARCLLRPFLAGVAASAAAMAVHLSAGSHLPPIADLALGGAIMFSLYAGILLFVLGEKDVYFELVRTLLKSSAGPATHERPVVP